VDSSDLVNQFGISNYIINFLVDYITDNSSSVNLAAAEKGARLCLSLAGYFKSTSFT
jgi:hypothetical protein